MNYKDKCRKLNCQLRSLSVLSATKHQGWNPQCIMIECAMRSQRMWASCPHTLPPYRLEWSLSLWMWNIPEPRCERDYNRHGRSDESKNSRSVQVSRSSSKRVWEGGPVRWSPAVKFLHHRLVNMGKCSRLIGMQKRICLALQSRSGLLLLVF